MIHHHRQKKGTRPHVHHRASLTGVPRPTPPHRSRGCYALHARSKPYRFATRQCEGSPERTARLEKRVASLVGPHVEPSPSSSASSARGADSLISRRQGCQGFQLLCGHQAGTILNSKMRTEDRQNCKLQRRRHESRNQNDMIDNDRFSVLC